MPVCLLDLDCKIYSYWISLMLQLVCVCGGNRLQHIGNQTVDVSCGFEH